MKKHIRVTYIANWYNSIYRDLFNAVTKDVVVTTILCEQFPKSEGAKHPVIILPNTRVEQFITPPFSKPSIYLPKYTYTELERVILVSKPDAIIANLLYLPATYQAYHIAKKHNIPFILQTEVKENPKGVKKLLYSLVDSLFSKRVVNGAKRIISWTAASQTYVNKRYKGTTSKTTTILPSVNIQQFYPRKKRASKTYTIMMIARYVGYKNHTDALQAMEQLIAKGENVHLNLYGDGPLKDSVREEIARRKLQAHVTIKGKVPHQQMPQEITNHDLLILPSTGEAIGICVIEALACGVPCIVSDTSGAKEYLIPNKTGAIYTTRDVNALVRTIQQWISKKNSVTITKACVAQAKKFSIERISAAFVQEIKKVTK